MTNVQTFPVVILYEGNHIPGDCGMAFVHTASMLLQTFGGRIRCDVMLGYILASDQITL